MNHLKDEYVCKGDNTPLITSNTVEGYFSIFKRSTKGIYQHFSSQHPHRYLAEFDFRYKNLT